MKWTSSGCAVVAVIVLGACSAGDTRIDPGDLALRDLLGIAPDVVGEWDGEQRAAARGVILAGFREDARVEHAVLATGLTVDERVARSLVSLDAERRSQGVGALGVVRVALGPSEVTATTRRAITAATAVTTADPAAPAIELWIGDQWEERSLGHLPGRGLDVLAALAVDAGHESGPVVVVPAPRLTVIAGYVQAIDGGRPARLVVNPVMLAVLEPDPGDVLPTVVHQGGGGGGSASATTAVAKRANASRDDSHARMSDPTVVANTAGNPYSFYGSIAECAFAQRTRCESCASGGADCTPLTDAPDGTSECDALAANNGRGYFLLCINLSLTISSVERCTADAAPGCVRDVDASGQLAAIENNAAFLDDGSCGGALDSCLDEIYGAPPEEFPGLDGGTSAPRPPRSTTVDCGDGCSSSNNNCEASPNCDCSGPSCNNSLSCDSACASSNGGSSGCGQGCEGCSSDTSSGGGGGCGGDSGGSSGGGDCSGGDCSSGDCSGGDCSGGDCSGGDCSGGDCSGGDCGGDSCGSGGSGSCNVGRRDSRAGLALVVSIVWAFLPVPLAAVILRRSRKRKAAAASEEAP